MENKAGREAVPYGKFNRCIILNDNTSERTPKAKMTAKPSTATVIYLLEKRLDKSPFSWLHYIKSGRWCQWARQAGR